MAVIRAGVIAMTLVCIGHGVRIAVAQEAVSQGFAERYAELPPLVEDVSTPDLIRAYGAAYGMSEWEIQRALRISWCESRYEHVPNRSGSGAYGPFQFMPRTAAGIGINPYVREQNVEGAIRLLASGQVQHWRWSQHCWGGR